MSEHLEILGKIRYEFYLVFLEPLWMICIISEVYGRVVQVWELCIAGTIHICRVAPWPAILLGDLSS